MTLSYSQIIFKILPVSSPLMIIGIDIRCSASQTQLILALEVNFLIILYYAYSVTFYLCSYYRARVNSVDNYVAQDSISITPHCVQNTLGTDSSAALRNSDAAVLSAEKENHVENLTQDLIILFFSKISFGGIRWQKR